MRNDLKDCLRTTPEEVGHAVMTGKVNARPFVNYTDLASDAFHGIRTLIETIRIDRLRDKEDRILCEASEDALLNLIKTTASALHTRACDLNGWAENRLVASEKAGGGDDPA